MQINKKLNLVIPVVGDAGTFYVHATPIDRTTFERFFVEMSRAWNLICTTGVQIIVGPRIAALTLKKISEQQGTWAGSEGVELGLMSEMRRLAFVVRLTDKGWVTEPFQSVIAQKSMSEEDIGEVEGQLAFFTLVSAMLKRNTAAAMLGSLGSLWETQTTLLNSTEFAASLPT